MNTYTETALKMLKAGFTPHPLRGKVPLLDGWQNLRNVTEAQVLEWDALFENVGIVCGESSQNLVVIDFDKLIGYEMFCKRFPSLAETLSIASGSGDGMHVYIRVDKLPDSVKFMNIFDAPKDVSYLIQGVYHF